MRPLLYILVIVGIISSVSGCVLLVDRSIHHQSQTTTQHHVRVHESDTRTTVVSGAKQTTQSTEKRTCGVFTLPSPHPKPTVIDLSSPTIQTQQEVEEAVAGYIQALRDYIDIEQARIDEAYRAYLRQCGL